MSFLIEVSNPYEPDDRNDERFEAKTIGEAHKQYLDLIPIEITVEDLEQEIHDFGGQTSWTNPETGRIVEVRRV